MLICTGVISELHKVFRQATKHGRIFYLIFPLNWDPEAERFITQNSFDTFWKIPFFALLTNGFLLTLYPPAKGFQLSVFEGTLFFNYLITISTLQSINVWFYHSHFRNLVNFFNKLIAFEKSNISQSNDDDFMAVGGKLMTTSIKPLATQLYSMKVNLGFVAAIYPTLPWNPLCAIVTKYWKVTPLFELNMVSICVRLGTMVIVWMTWSTFLNFVFLTMTVNFLSTLFCFKCALNLFGRNLLQANKSELECHWKLLKKLKMFRQIQLLINEYNAIHKQSMMLVIVATVLFSAIMSAYTILNSGGSLSVPLLLVMVLILCMCFFVMVIGMMYPASVYSMSGHILQNTKKYFQPASTSFNLGCVRKYWLSFPVFKIQFFSGNFFEQATPLVFMDFCANMIVNLLMIH
ncbi:unnamed protein product [Orchesella dallaii]|uniref:Odorant receptor n=1 Tax=Orchesella dallaii TaxID=48710 RepID=A0ABP1RT81_9HEXA